MGGRDDLAAKGVETPRRRWPWRSGPDAESAPFEPPVRVGDVGTWWIRKPVSPRLSIPGAAGAWGLLGPAVVGTLLWVHERGESLWPYGHETPSFGQQILKYAMVMVVFLAYATIRSIPMWWSSLRLSAADARRLPTLIATQDWAEAARVLHRYCLLRGVVWRRVPRRAAAWDEQIRPHLPARRRLYVYYRGTAPALPEDPTSSFAPEVIAVGTPTGWAFVALVPLFVMLYFMVGNVFSLEPGQWRQLISLNTLLMGLLIVGYGTFYTLILLGRVSYVRLAPGVAQWLQFSAFRRRPRVQTLDVRAYDVTLDTSGQRYVFCLVNRADSFRAHTFRLPASAEVATACLRTVLSSAPTPPLSDDPLEG